MGTVDDGSRDNEDVGHGDNEDAGGDDRANIRVALVEQAGELWWITICDYFPLENFQLCENANDVDIHTVKIITMGLNRERVLQ